ncbi:MAG: dihydroneopterin aldolase [Candidatus Neomarinimicrobiota bacterium]
MGKIRLNNMLFYGYHGVDESEQDRGGTFEVDLELRASLADAATSDSLKRTIDYSEVYQTVHDCLTDKRFFLLETLAGHIANSILEKYQVDSVQVNVRKRHAPVKGVMGSVEVEIERDRHSS